MSFRSLFEDKQKGAYMLLGRLQGDCDYFLNAGNGSEKGLWGITVKDHIKEMKKIYKSLNEKPQWISMDDIKKYEKDMLKKLK